MQGIYKFGHLSIHREELRLHSLGQLQFHLIATLFTEYRWPPYNPTANLR